MSGRSGFGLIPGPAKILAAVAFVVFFFGLFEEYRASGLGTLIGLAGGTLAGAYFLLAGYVYSRRSAARYAADSLDGARGGHSELRWLRALLPVAKADPASVSQLRARSCTRCRVLSPMWPAANEHGTATLTGRILKNEPWNLGAPK
jgi:hypothetical protein